MEISKNYAIKAKELGVTKEDLQKNQKFMRIYAEYKDTKDTLQDFDECDTNNDDYKELIGIAERFDNKMVLVVEEIGKLKKQAQETNVERSVDGNNYDTDMKSRIKDHVRKMQQRQNNLGI